MTRHGKAFYLEPHYDMHEKRPESC